MLVDFLFFFASVVRLSPGLLVVLFILACALVSCVSLLCYFSFLYFAACVPWAWGVAVFSFLCAWACDLFVCLIS